MAGSASILIDDSRLSRLDRALFRVEGWMTVIAGLAVLSLMFLAVWSVGGRNFFQRPLAGYVDWIEAIMPAIALLGIAYTQRLGGHIRLDLFVGRFRGRALYVVEFFTTLVMLAFTLLLIWGTWMHFDRSFDLSRPLFSADSSIDIGLPIWPAKLVVPVALTVLALRLVLQLVAYGRAVRTGETPPGVPRIETPEEIALAEARAVAGEETNQ